MRIDGERLFAITGPVALRAGGDREIDEVGSAEALELARNLGVRAVIQGRATLRKDTDFDVPVTESACVKRSSKNKKRCIERQTLIIHCAELSVALKYNVLALETTGGRLIYDPGVKRLVERHRDCVRYPAEQAYAAVERLEDKLEEAADELRSVLLAEAVDRIHHDIAPYTKTFAVTFLTEPDVLAGAPAERFAVAADLIKDRRFRAGCRIWRGMVEAGRHDPALTYNLAACAEQDENYGVARQFYALTQRHADGLQARAGGEDRTYSYEDWSKLVAMAQERVGLLHRSQQAINVLRAEPLP